MSKDVKIKDSVSKLADTLRKAASVDENNVVNFPGDIFVAHLPEGLTAGDVKAVDLYKQDFAAAQALVTGELAIEQFKKSEDVKDVHSKVALPVGKSVSIVLRQADFRNPQTGEIKTSYAHTSARIVTQIPGNSMLAVRTRLAALAKEAGIAN